MAKKPNDTPSSTSPATILQVLPRLRSGGVERGTLEIAAALIKAGHRALVASEGGPMVSQLTRLGAEHITLPLSSKNPLSIWRNAGRLQDLIKKENISLVHARSRAPAWSAFKATQKTNTPFVTTFHGSYNLGGPLKKRYNSIMTRGDRVIAISHFIADHIRHHYPMDESRLSVIHRGVDTELFDPARFNRSRLIELSREWALPDDRLILLAPGRFTRWKGQHLLIDALAKIKDLPFFCVMAGDDDGHSAYRRELEAQVIKLGLGAHVRIAGPTRDMPTAYMLAHAVIVPSTKPEAFGRVIAEAGAMGKPIIASDHGGAQEIIMPGTTGWLVPPGDAIALSERIATTLHTSPEALATLASIARPHIVERFSKTAMCDKTLALYDELLKTKATA